MKLESPDAGRTTVFENDGGIQVVISTRKNWFVILFVGFWLCGWALGEVTVLGILVGSVGQESNNGGLSPGAGLLFLLVWLCAWTVGGVVALSMFLWNLSGFERVTLKNGILTIERRIPFWVRRRDYDAREISRMRTASERRSASMWGNNAQMPGFLRDFRQGTIQFDYGRGMRAFGLELDDVEAQDIVAVLGKDIAT